MPNLTLHDMIIIYIPLSFMMRTKHDGFGWIYKAFCIQNKISKILLHLSILLQHISTFNLMTPVGMIIGIAKLIIMIACTMQIKTRYT